jgi:hypothetical protein
VDKRLFSHASGLLSNRIDVPGTAPGISLVESERASREVNMQLWDHLPAFDLLAMAFPEIVGQLV